MLPKHFSVKSMHILMLPSFSYSQLRIVCFYKHKNYYNILIQEDKDLGSIQVTLPKNRSVIPIQFFMLPIFSPSQLRILCFQNILSQEDENIGGIIIFIDITLSFCGSIAFMLPRFLSSYLRILSQLLCFQPVKNTFYASQVFSSWIGILS